MKIGAIIFSVATIWGVGVTVGCSRPTQDVDYYKAHPEERSRVVADCGRDLSKAQRRDDCANAEKAEFEGKPVKKTPGKAY